MWKALCIYERVTAPHDQVCGLLAGLHEHVLDIELPDGPDAPRARLGATVAGIEVSKHVRLARGSLHREGRLATVPLRCRAADHPGLFPCLEATLEIMPLGNGKAPVTELCLVGRYRPPFGVFGNADDALGGHGIAEASLRRFLSEVAARIQAQCDLPEQAAGGCQG